MVDGLQEYAVEVEEGVVGDDGEGFGRIEERRGRKRGSGRGGVREAAQRGQVGRFNELVDVERASVQLDARSIGEHEGEEERRVLVATQMCASREHKVRDHLWNRIVSIDGLDGEDGGDTGLKGETFNVTS